jgi:hypothetical protein
MFSDELNINILLFHINYFKNDFKLNNSREIIYLFEKKMKNFKK